MECLITLSALAGAFIGFLIYDHLSWERWKRHQYEMGPLKKWLEPDA